MNQVTHRIRLLAASAALLFAAPGAAHAGDIKFSVGDDYQGSTVTYNGTESPGAVAYLYRNGHADRNADLVVGNTGGGPVILYGTGHGRFSPRTVVTPADTDASAIQVADFNADGIPDIVSGGYTTPRITVSLGRPDGSFVIGGQYPLQGVWVSHFEVADLNRDGHLDIATSAYYGGTLTILLGKGDGTFKEAAPVPATQTDLAMIVADFDKDSIPDIAVTESNASPEAPTTPDQPSKSLLHGTVNILKGKGDGTFKQVDVYPVGVLSEVIRYGDIDEDGRGDLFIFNALITNDASIFMGLDGGKFGPERRMRLSGASTNDVQDIRAGDSSEGLQLVDFNRDGHLDMAVTQIISSRLLIYEGDGHGQFSPAGSYSTSGFPEDLMAGDLNGDGCPDLAVPGNEPPVGGRTDVGIDRVTVYLNLSAGCHKPAAAAAALQCTVRQVVIEDVRIRGRRVNFVGVAALKFAGRTVSLRSDGTGRIVARAKVRSDGRFSGSAPLPARRLRATTRYRANIGSQRSNLVKLVRRITVRSLTRKSGKVTITGRVSRPLANPRALITLTRRISCRYRVVRRFRPRADGTFAVTVTAPKGVARPVYRVGTRVRPTARHRKTLATVSLPLYYRGT